MMNKRKSLVNSLYWRCQLSGWGLFFIGLQLEFALYNRYFQRPLIWYFLSRGFIFILLGILISHLLRRLIHRVNLFEKKFRQQLAYLFLFLVAAPTIFVMLAYLIDYRAMANETERYGSVLAFTYFKTAFPFTIWILLYYTVGYVKRLQESRINVSFLENQRFELEAQALRAQMNPHFMFNCLNSIKALIQENKKDEAAIYLSTFSRLIRTLFNNAEKNEISLYEEIETCKLYLELEAMRFDGKMAFVINIDQHIDLNKILMPALTIQPFIENAVWHGIVPKFGGGTVTLSVKSVDGVVEINIDDDGIGREASRLGKSIWNFNHQSKGVTMTQTRFDLDNFLRHRKAKVSIGDKCDMQGKASGTCVKIVLIPG